MKRFVVDCLGNYIFFVPLVVLFTPALRSVNGFEQYAIAAIPVTLIGSRLYTLFLAKIWYPLWKVKF